MKIPWRKEWLPTPVFLLGESHGQQSLAGYSPWGHKESDTTEPLSTHCIHLISLVIPQFCWSQSVFESLCLFLTRSGLMSVGWMEVVYPLIRLLSHFLSLSCGRFLVHILALSYWVPLASLLSSSTAEVQFSEWTRAQKPWWKISSFGLQLGRLWRASLAFWLPCVHAHVHAKSPHACPTLYDTMACSPPDSSVHEILQARILGGGVAISSSKGSSQPRDRTWVSYVSCIRRWALYH